MKSTQKKLFTNLLVLVLCVAMLTGTTFAWFTDSATSTGNIVKAGKLDLKMFWTDDLTSGNWHDVEGVNKTLFDERDSQGNEIYWEPGYTEVRYIKIQNTGNLAFNFDITLEAADPANVGELAPAINVYAAKNVQANVADRADLGQSGFGSVGMLNTMMNGGKVVSGTVIPADQINPQYYSGETIVAIALQMIPTAGNEYQGKNLGAGFNIKAVATQCAYEEDAFGNNYDGNATPGTTGNTLVSTSVTAAVTSAGGKVAEPVVLASNGVKATVPAGVVLNDGVSELTFTVEPLEDTASGITAVNDQMLIPVDVHVEGVSEDNTVPVIIELGEILPKYLNMGNFTLVHVENGTNQTMTYVADAENLSEHNQFTYDSNTGAVTVAMATFSEVALVADTANVWKGTTAAAFAGGTGAEDDPYLISNADQLAYLGNCISNDNENYGKKHYRLIADINLGGSKQIFYPIGYHKKGGTIATLAVDDEPEAYYEITEDSKNPGSTLSESESVWYTYGGSFKGVFDGAGHTISDIYQNTWSMKGNYSGNYWNAAMGLFGYVNGGTVKNLTVDNFSSDGEFTPTGVIAAYATNSTFENIAITNCNPRVYNTGNGGIVGIGGNSDDPDTYKLTFTNITIDNSNKISALWGSWDVACGGLVGMFRGAGHVHMTNCHVAAQIDVYNDVCGNYQYYWYRYAGMMVGTNKNMTTDANGYTVPETSKFHAEKCTVHFGNWNDYYYCELVANSLASYTHDHQFSRLEQIQNVSEIQDANGNWNKAGNFILMNGKTPTATCYHIVTKNGVLEQHTHESAGTETVNGVEVLKEDKQRVYLPFNQLFTGYGWGVKHVPVYNGEDYAFEGITILDRISTSSGNKFDAVNTTNSYTTGTTVSVGDLFKAKADYTEDIDKDNVQVFVSPVGEESTAGATYVANTTDWTQGTLTFSGLGTATVTITDYYFCTPTVITITVAEPEPVKKFDLAFENTDKYLYRVGNANTVALGSLFKAKDGAEIGNVTIDVAALNDASVSGVYNANATDWTKGTIQFNGTGPVKVTIKDEKYCEPTVLNLEVINATNITKATDAKSNDVVLLNDITGTFTVSNGHTFHGNGFKVTCSGNGSYGSKALSFGFITVSNGGVLDNVQVICDIFPESYLYTSEMKADSNGNYPYAKSAIAVSDNSTISNCYVYGARNNIFVGTGNVAIKNTVTECGSLANIHIKSSDANVVTLDSVTTIQYQTESNYDTSKKVLGFGIVVGDNESASNPKIKLTGDLNQYNWVTSDNTSVSNTYAQTAIKEALKVEAYQHTIGGKTSVNTGIAYLNDKAANIEDVRSNKDEVPYALNSITMLTYTGQVYSITGASGITETEKPGYNPETNAVIMPILSVGEDNTAVSFESAYDKTSGSWLNELSVDLDNIDGGTYAFQFNKLSVKKYGTDLSYTVTDSKGNAVSKDATITLDQLATEEYTILITDNLIYDANGNKTGETLTHNVPFVIKATKTSIEPPKFTNAGTATAIRLVSSKGGDWRPAYTALTGVSVTYWSASESKVKTVDLSTLYNSGTISSNVWTYTCDDYTLTITGGAVHSDGTVITPVVSNNTLYFASTNKAFGTGTTSRSMIMNYVFTDKNASTPWNRTESVTYSDLSEYDYTKFKNGTLEAPSSGGLPCVTPDTLVTLADGSQKEIQHVTYDDQLLVWDFVNGEYTSAPSSIVMNHGYGNYDVVTLNFADGTVVNTINGHGFFDESLNKFVIISKNNVADFVGHKFIKEDGTVTELADYSINTEYTESWSVLTAVHYNCILEGMLTVTPAEVEGSPDYLMPYVVGDDMKYDSEAMQADIEKYGLYTYEEFADLLTPEQFYGLGLQNFKVAVGKSYITYDEILFLIDLHMN